MQSEYWRICVPVWYALFLWLLLHRKNVLILPISSTKYMACVVLNMNLLNKIKQNIYVNSRCILPMNACNASFFRSLRMSCVSYFRLSKYLLLLWNFSHCFKKKKLNNVFWPCWIFSMASHDKYYTRCLKPSSIFIIVKVLEVLKSRVTVNHCHKSSLKIIICNINFYPKPSPWLNWLLIVAVQRDYCFCFATCHDKFTLNAQIAINYSPADWVCYSVRMACGKAQFFYHL